MNSTYQKSIVVHQAHMISTNNDCVGIYGLAQVAIQVWVSIWALISIAGALLHLTFVILKYLGKKLRWHKGGT